MKRIRFGILGARRGASLARAMQSAPTAELVALCDIDEAQVTRAAADIGISKTYTSWEAMLDTDIDAVVVASPMPLHVPHSVAAIAAGKHVLSEVTAATSIEQCWELLEAVRASDRK